MKISKNSKVLKYVREFNHSPLYPSNIDIYGNPLDLCSLIRAVVVSAIATIFITVVLLFAAYTFTTPFQSLIAYFFFPTYSLFIADFATGIGVVEVGLLSLYLIHTIGTRWLKRFDKWRYNRLSNDNSKFNIVPKEPNILVQYIKDKHNKVCRRVELTDD